MGRTKYMGYDRISIFTVSYTRRNQKLQKCFILRQAFYTPGLKARNITGTEEKKKDFEFY